MISAGKEEKRSLPTNVRESGFHCTDLPLDKMEENGSFDGTGDTPSREDSELESILNVSFGCLSLADDSG